MSQFGPLRRRLRSQQRQQILWNGLVGDGTVEPVQQLLAMCLAGEKGADRAIDGAARLAAGNLGTEGKIEVIVLHVAPTGLFHNRTIRWFRM
jgi:hypothetical protein